MNSRAKTKGAEAAVSSTTRMPPGPWLLVVGMHRSGTSAVTGALGSLGFAVPVEEDRWEPSSDNPDHWESRGLAVYCDTLLERLGGTWDRPPEPTQDDQDVGVDSIPGDPSVPAMGAFPGPGPVVWKDPRSCLLLPYWRAHLPGPLAVVFIWRAPLSVARSLQARDRMHLADGIALWERYNRCALEGLAGVDTYVTRYEDIVADPATRLHAIAAWLGNLPQFEDHARVWDLAGAAATISPELQRQQSNGDDDLMLPEQHELVGHLERLDGPHRPFPASPEGPESPWTTAILGDRHQLAVLSRQRDELRQTARRLWFEMEAAHGEIAARQTHIEMLEDEVEAARAELSDVYELYEQMQSSTSWRITRPLRRAAALRPDGHSSRS